MYLTQFTFDKALKCNVVFFYPLVFPPLPANHCTQNTVASNSLVCKVSAVTLSSLLRHTSYFNPSHFELILIIPPFEFLTPISCKKDLHSLFDYIFSPDVIAFAKTKPVLISNFLYSNDTKFINALNSVNEFFASKLAPVHDVSFVSPGANYDFKALYPEKSQNASTLLLMLERFGSKVHSHLLSEKFETTITTLMKNEEHFLLEEEETGQTRAERVDLPHVLCSINGHTFPVLIDCGAQVTLISEEFLETLKDTTKSNFPTLPVTNINIRGVTGVRSKNVTKQVYLDITFNGTAFPFSVLVVPKSNVQFLLGIDFLKKYKSTMDCVKETLSLSEGSCVVPWIKYPSHQVSTVVSIENPSDRKRKVLIFSDSHGRNLYHHLKPLMPHDVELHVHFRGGEKFNKVLKRAKPHLENPTEGDIIVIIGGTNNIDPEKSLDELVEQLDLSPLLHSTSEILLCEILPRFDIVNGVPHAKSLNSFLRSKLKSTPNVTFLNSTDSLTRNSFTDRGVHLNGKGKALFAELLSEALNRSLAVDDLNNPQVHLTQIAPIHSFSDLKTSEIFIDPKIPTKMHAASLTETSNPSCSSLDSAGFEEVRQKFLSEEMTLQERLDLASHCYLAAPLTSESDSEGRRAQGGITVEEIYDKLKDVNVTPQEKLELASLLYNNKDVFSENPGCCNSFTAKLRFNDTKPFSKKSYPIPFAKRNLVRNEIKRLLDLGIIERSFSPYSNPLVPVIKKDQTVRLCIDARELNARLVTDSESPELVENLITRFNKPKCMSTLDCTASFLQIPLAEESRDATSFLFEGRNYRFCRVPFGLNVSMQLFIKATDTVFAEETEEYLARYVDDFKVVSSTFDLHLAHLQSVFSALRKAGMTLKFSKCFFLLDEIEYLGFTLSQEGITKNPGKVHAIANFPTPRNVKHLQSFIGLVNFYRKFHDQHSELLSPLLHLLKKGTRFIWTQSEEEAFQKIKETFAEKVVLSYIDFSKPMYLNTDCSLVALSGELYQIDGDGYRRPVVFYSRVLSSCERNYTTTEQELLAIVACCQKLRQFLLGHQVIVQTDHHSLQFLRNCILSTGRLTRWNLFLQEYNLEIHYLKASENIAADTLSRFPPEFHELPPNNLALNVNVIFWPDQHLQGIENITKLIEADPIYGPILNKIKEKSDDHLQQFYSIHNNNLFLKSKKSPKYLLCIPKTLENSIISKSHENLGHLGANKVYCHLKTVVIFPQMQKKIREFVKSCLDCQQSKISTKNVCPLQPVLASSCLELVSVDIYGPLPKSFGNLTCILVVLDIFSKYVRLIPVRSATGVIVTRRFIKGFVEQIGKPVTVISDHGPCFRSAIWDRSLKQLGIQPRHTSVYHPQSNPVERYMRTLGNFFRVYCHDKHKSWVNYLAFFERCLNNSINDSTGCAPVEVLTGTPAHCFLKSLIKFPEENQENQNSRLVMAEENLKKNAQKRKEKHDGDLSGTSFTTGMKVLLRSHHLSNALYGEIKKFFRLYEGPYLLGRPVGRNAFELNDPESGESRGTHNISNLKPFNG